MGNLPGAVFFDAYGTLITWRPDRSPAQIVAAGLELAGVLCPFDVVERALQAEMAYYRDHHAHVRTAKELADLRRRAAAVLRDGLDLDAREAPPIALLVELLLSAFETRAFPDALPAIQRVRQAGLRAAVLSNFSFLLPVLLEEVGLAAHLDPIVFSAAAGAAKPQPEIFTLAARAAQAAPGDCVLIGNDLVSDVEGARGVGMPVVWLARDGSHPPAGVAATRNLTEAVELALAPGWRRLSLPME